MKSTSVPKSRNDNIPLAVGVIIFTVLALSLGDALIKLTSRNFVIWQIFVVRSLIAIPFLVLFLAIRSPELLRVPDTIGWTVLRSILLVAMWVSYYLSLPNLSLSIAAAAYYTLPIFITLFSAVIIGERIGRNGWLAVFIGFAGVLLILQPRAGDFNGFVLLPLLSAMLYAFAMILTRTKCQSEDPIILSLALNVTFVVVGGTVALFIAILMGETREGFLLAPWAVMGLSEWLSMGLLATAILVGSVGTAIAYQKGPSSLIGTFDFAYVGFAVLWGIIFFADIPDAATISGMVMIVGAGALSLRQ